MRSRLFLGITAAIVGILLFPAAVNASPESLSVSGISHSEEHQAEYSSRFFAQGTISTITSGTVIPLSSGKWKILNREITGTISGSIEGKFNITYHGVFDLATQAGTFEGDLKAQSYKIEIEGTTLPLTMASTPSGLAVPMITLYGKWSTSQTGITAKGIFSGWFVFVPTPDGHISQIVSSSLTMTGKTKVDFNRDDDED